MFIFVCIYKTSTISKHKYRDTFVDKKISVDYRNIKGKNTSDSDSCLGWTSNQMSRLEPCVSTLKPDH